MHEEKQETFVDRHLSGVVVLSLYFVLFTMDYFWRVH
jgi:hypothetical protein